MITNFDDVLFKLKTEPELDIQDIIDNLTPEEVKNLQKVVDGWFSTKAYTVVGTLKKYFGIGHLSVTLCLNICKNNLHLAYELYQESPIDDDWDFRDELIKAFLREVSWPTFWPTWGDPEEYRIQWYKDFDLYLRRRGFYCDWKRFEK